MWRLSALLGISIYSVGKCYMKDGTDRSDDRVWGTVDSYLIQEHMDRYSLCQMHQVVINEIS